MVKSTKKKKYDNDNDNSEIIDERFAAAATHPQFQKGRSRTHHHDNDRPRKNEQSDNNNKTLHNSNSNNDNNDDVGGSLVINSSSHDGGATTGGGNGLGASLTEAIASDDRFKAALLDDDKFGCVPSRDKYGRKTGKKSKKKRGKRSSKREEEDGEEEVGGEDEAKQQDDSEEEEEEEQEEEQDNSMEARIAYLNALSRGDISASSSSEDDDDASSDGESDDDDDSSTSSTDDVYGKSGIFDPNHAPLPGDHISDNEQQQANDDHDDDYEEAAELTHEPSPHLCILNLNWEHTRAVDVYAMLHSFCPPGTLKTVEVYPSDFGRERMEKERVEGPTGLWKRDKQKNEKGEKDEDEDGEGKFWSSDDESNGSEDENESLSDQDDAKLNEKDAADDEHDSDLNSDDDDEDIHNLAEATSKLYAHFPPQSTIMKNSQLRTEEEEEEGFDIEKLREYEASKLRYYFAIATFATPSAAGTVYENVDGMEMEHSAAEIDVRVLPVDAYESTVEDRPLRDECHKLPAKYIPPENVVTTALRQSRVTCSWERGDTDREKKLTNWGMGKDAWDAMAEGDDIGLYLATSDNSSVGSESEEEDGENENDVAVAAVDEKRKKKKGAGMRAMLGLADSDDDDNGSVDVEKLLEDQSISEDSSAGSGESSADEMEDVAVSKKKHSKMASPDTESESGSDDDEADTKQVTFIPGKRNLEDKIRSKLHSKHNGGSAANAGDDGQLSPFEKYLEKRREKRRERKKAAKEGANGRDADDEESLDDKNDVGNDDDGMYGVDSEFGMAQFSDEEEGEPTTSNRDFGTGETGDNDGFFLGESTTSSSTKKKGKNSKRKEKMRLESAADDGTKLASTKEELALLIAGDDGK